MNDGLPLDTGVLIALAAATGSWDVLDVLGRPVLLTPTILIKSPQPGFFLQRIFAFRQKKHPREFFFWIGLRPLL